MFVPCPANRLGPGPRLRRVPVTTLTDCLGLLEILAHTMLQPKLIVDELFHRFVEEQSHQLRIIRSRLDAPASGFGLDQGQCSLPSLVDY